MEAGEKQGWREEEGKAARTESSQYFMSDKKEQEKEGGRVGGESEGRRRGRKEGKKRNLRKLAPYQTIHKMPPRADCIKGISRIKQSTNRQRCERDQRLKKEAFSPLYVLGKVDIPSVFEAEFQPYHEFDSGAFSPTPHSLKNCDTLFLMTLKGILFFLTRFTKKK